MAKRALTSDSNNANWSNEDEPEEECTPKLASPEVMSKRVIKTGKRRVLNSTPTVSVGKSAFSNFGGFGATSSSSTDLKSTFSFLSNSPSTFNNTNGISSSKNDLPSKQGTFASSANDNINCDASNEYLSKLKGLNESVSEWIKIHVSKNPTCILTPIFDDYAKYLKELQSEKHRRKPDSKQELIPSPPGNMNLSSSGMKPFFNNSLFPPNNESSPKLSHLSGTSPSLTSGKSPLTNIFKCNNSQVLFTPPVSSDSTTEKPSSSGFESAFSLGNTTTPSNAEEDNVTDDEPPKNNFKPVVEEHAVFSQRVKLFLKKEDNFVDNGVGTLFIKPADKEGTKYQAIVRADSSLGNILLNIILKESLPSKRVGRNNVMLVCILEVEKKLKSIPALLRVKTEEEADNLLEQINKYKKAD